jgi:hypothetical protein
MSREEELISKGDEAKRRLGLGMERSKALLSQYRASLLALREALDRQRSAVVPARIEPSRQQR